MSNSDRARISTDARQLYRSVVMQQGRVTLEADWNEAQDLTGEEQRKEALDFVGPAGTPDGGYAITFPSGFPPFDFQAAAGTMYVGGVRAFLPAPVQYSQQTDWLDNIIDPDWVPLPTQPPGNEFVYLLLNEREVSAVEDSDLKDVALGGPDTGQRKRLVQHIVRETTNGTDCTSALLQAETAWTAEGLTFDPATMRLNSSASLQVSFTDPGGAPTPCDPTAQGGYLGADNQLIQVKVSSAGSSLAGGFTGRFAGASAQILWGFDNASFLYRVDVIDPQTLKLQSAPIDAEHQPQDQQAVEVLMAAAQLANGEYVAAHDGFVVSLLGAYNPDTQTVKLRAPLPSQYGDGNPNHPHPARVFLRVWQQELPFSAGTPVVLGDTGVQVTLTTANNAPFHAGDYWIFAVRPSTPQQIYPERYLAAPQPPEGPREWACPLAVIQATSSGGTVLADCRNPFDNLVDLTRRKLSGCCTVNVSPSDLSSTNTLQAIFDRFRGEGGVNVCLMPGQYDLTGPLTLTADHSNFNVEACAGGVFLQAAQGSEAAFSQGMVIVNGAHNVSFDGIHFEMPLVPLGTAATPATGIVLITQVFVSFGLRPINCSGLTVENCEFVCSAAPNAGLIGVGILAGGECTQLSIQHNLFRAPAGASASPGSFTSAFTLVPATVSSSLASNPLKSGASAQVLVSRINQALFRDNIFEGLTLATFVYADCGLVDIESNTARNCLNGFWFFSLPSLAFTNNLADIKVAAPFAAAASNLHNAIFTTLAHPAVQLASATLRNFPLPDKVDLSKAIPVAVSKPATAAKDVAPVESVFNQALTLAPHLADKTKATAADKQVALREVATTITAHPVQATVSPQFDVTLLHQNLSIVEKQAFAVFVPAAPLALTLADNEISTEIVGAASGAGFLVLHLGKDDRDVVSMNSSSCIGANGSAPLVLILGPSRSTVTGNMVLNEASSATGLANIPVPSLWLFPLPVASSVDGSMVAAATATGNVFRGQPILPARNLSPAPPPPMDKWDFFNSET